jgi:GH15 family glucan-1,4-alpha-glucosidase
MYGITGKREHSEWSAKWLTGYEDSKPVHIGNKASDQLQLDTFGEVMDTLYRARCHGLYPLQDKSGEAIEIPFLNHLEKVWRDPDEGLWDTPANSASAPTEPRQNSPPNKKSNYSARYSVAATMCMQFVGRAIMGDTDTLRHRSAIGVPATRRTLKTVKGYYRSEYLAA